MIETGTGRMMMAGNMIAVGQVYEADGWTRYQRLSYDGWWSFITDAGIKESWKDGSWNTAGVSGNHDSLFDVAQLTDNRLAFVGLKGTSGRRFLGRYTHAATPDTGFIVAGMVKSGHPSAQEAWS